MADTPFNTIRAAHRALTVRAAANTHKAGNTVITSAKGAGVPAYPAEEDAVALNRTVLNFGGDAFALTDVAGVVAYVGKKIYDFPEGQIMIAGAVADLKLGKSSTGVNATFNGDFSLGTATASNNATLSSTEADVIPSTATPAAVAGVTTAKGLSTANIVLDGTAAAKSLYLNFLVDDADQDVTTTPCNLLVTGTVTVLWSKVGDK
jgi:hypothetical protein